MKPHVKPMRHPPPHLYAMLQTFPVTSELINPPEIMVVVMVIMMIQWWVIIPATVYWIQKLYWINFIYNYISYWQFFTSRIFTTFYESGYELKESGNFHEVPQQVNRNCFANLGPTLWCWASVLRSEESQKWLKKEGIISSIKDLKFCHPCLLPICFPHTYLRICPYMSVVPMGEHIDIILE